MKTIKRSKIFSDCECRTLPWEYEEDVKGLWCDAKEVAELEQELHDSELRRKDLLTSLQRSNAQKAELEQELTKLKESQTQKSIIKLCNRVDKAEADKAELKKAISFYYTYHKDSRNDGIIFEEFNKICPMK